MIVHGIVNQTSFLETLVTFVVMYPYPIAVVSLY